MRVDRRRSTGNEEAVIDTPDFLPHGPLHRDQQCERANRLRASFVNDVERCFSCTAKAIESG